MYGEWSLYLKETLLNSTEPVKSVTICLPPVVSGSVCKNTSSIFSVGLIFPTDRKESDRSLIAPRTVPNATENAIYDDGSTLLSAAMLYSIILEIRLIAVVSTLLSLIKRGGEKVNRLLSEYSPSHFAKKRFSAPESRIF